MKLKVFLSVLGTLFLFSCTTDFWGDGGCPGKCKTDSDGDGVYDYKDECPDTPPGVEVDEVGCPLIVFLDDNGVTIRCYEWAEVGDSGEVNGVTYTIVDEAMLREMVNNGEDVTQVCTCKVTDMSFLFLDQADFDQDISSWDVSNVTTMQQMFKRASSFNQPIGNWDVSSVNDMRGVFDRASSFNQPIGNWDVSNVTTMRFMFSYTGSFNQPLADWDVSGVRDMSYMFVVANSFNQPIGSWDVSSVTEMRRMFIKARSFNQDLSAWDVSNVTICSDFDDDTPQWTLPKPNFTNCTP